MKGLLIKQRRVFVSKKIFERCPVEVFFSSAMGQYFNERVPVLLVSCALLATRMHCIVCEQGCG